MQSTFAFVLGFVMLAASCNESGSSKSHNMNGDHEHTNALIDETSPYLLQHAHNPVNWYPWGDEALDKAKAENKPILVSIGYSACHWCHVMEKESFEDSAIAAMMNENFICIKVDREERPDIDQVYMNAVQLITQRGGWPLNCFAMPDGKPIYGGTYFPPEQWTKVCDQIASEYATNPEKLREYAEKLTVGVQESELIALNTAPADFNMPILNGMVGNWQGNFDNKDGGPNKAPKFPIPNNYQFLMRYGHANEDQAVLDHVYLTLDKMAYGGIYDQLGGGFARYSTDIKWKVPHFEKMLYDNAQLVSLYSEAFQATKNPLYKDIVYETLEWVDREMTSKEGAFYSALDADSEGEEGKFYVWTKEDLQAELGEEFDVFADFYNVNAKGLWEHGNYILLRDKQDEAIAKAHDITVEELDEKIEAAKAKLMKVRDNRIRPGLDDKTLTSWNAMMTKGYVDAYQVFGEEKFLDVALKNANFILEKQLRDDMGLNHNYKEGKSNINGYLEDYSFTIDAFLSLYEATFDEKWLNHAKGLSEYAISHFYNADRGMFFFTSDEDKALVARKMELMDNVIPSSNSTLANGLFKLSHYFDDVEMGNISKQMLNNVKEYIGSYPSSYSNWGLLMLNHVETYYEIAISGKKANEMRMAMKDTYIPFKMFVGSANDSKLPLLEMKYVEGETMIYVCLNRVCNLPVTDPEEALKQIK